MDSFVKHLNSRITSISCTTFTSHPKSAYEWIKLVEANTNYHVFPYLRPSTQNNWAAVSALLSDPATTKQFPPRYNLLFSTALGSDAPLLLIFLKRRNKLIDVAITIQLPVAISSMEILPSSTTLNNQVERLDEQVLNREVCCRVFLSNGRVQAICIPPPLNNSTIPQPTTFQLPPQISNLASSQQFCPIGHFILQAGKDRIGIIFQSQLHTNAYIVNVLDPYISCHILSVVSDIPSSGRKVCVTTLLKRLKVYCATNNKILIFASSLYVPASNFTYSGGSFICQGLQVLAENSKCIYETSGNIKGFVDIKKLVTATNYAVLNDVIRKYKEVPLLKIRLDCAHVIGLLKSTTQLLTPQFRSEGSIPQKDYTVVEAGMDSPRFYFWWLLRKFNRLNPIHLLVGSKILEEHNIKVMYLMNAVAEDIVKLRLTSLFGEDCSYAYVLSRLLRIIVVVSSVNGSDTNANGSSEIEGDLERCDSRVIQKIYRALKLMNMVFTVYRGTDIKQSLSKLISSANNTSEYHFYTENEQYVKALSQLSVEQAEVHNKPVIYLSRSFLSDIDIKLIIPNYLKIASLPTSTLSSSKVDPLHIPEKRVILRSIVTELLKKTRDPDELLFMLKEKFSEEDLKVVYSEALRRAVALDMRNDRLTQYVMQKEWAQCHEDLVRMHRWKIKKQQSQNAIAPSGTMQIEENGTNKAKETEQRLLKSKISKIRQRKKLDMKFCHACGLQLPLDYGNVCGECSQFLCYDCFDSNKNNPSKSSSSSRMFNLPVAGSGCLVCKKECTCNRCVEQRQRQAENVIRTECHKCKLDYFHVSATHKTPQEQIYYICSEVQCREVFCLKCIKSVQSEQAAVKSKDTKFRSLEPNLLTTLSVVDTWNWRCLVCQNKCKCLLCKSKFKKSAEKPAQPNNSQQRKQTVLPTGPFFYLNSNVPVADPSPNDRRVVATQRVEKTQPPRLAEQQKKSANTLLISSPTKTKPTTLTNIQQQRNKPAAVELTPGRPINVTKKWGDDDESSEQDEEGQANAKINRPPPLVINASSLLQRQTSNNDKTDKGKPAPAQKTDHRIIKTANKPVLEFDY